VISYFPRRNIELRALSRDSGTVSIGVRHQLTFGGGESRPPSERRVRPIISGITIAGSDAAIEAVARAEIKLEAGDEFDFLELQEDVDRVREAFHELGYLEARVRTRREESDDARSVALEFRVERGPRTLLEIHGFVPPAGLIEELEEAWHRNVFDQFLVDDLTHRVRRHLVDSGELASIVVGRIDRPAEDTKRLRIEVTPGAPVTGREIRVSGNVALDAARLNEEIQAAGLELEAWLDRTLVERTLRQAYLEEGFLKAEVVAAPLTIDGTTGVLPVTIKEGPRAQITNLSWAGVGEGRLPAIEKATELKTPAPYVAADVNAARLRIEEHYLEQGFNDVEVEALPEIAADDTVTLRFNVSEGAQQVLQSVEVTGNDVTRGNVIREALRFELGAPVDLDAWAVARKRLYDTNVFRQVDIEPVPVGEAVNGVQQVKAVVAVEEVPEWSFRYGFQLEGERRAELEQFTSTRNGGVVSEIRNPNLFGRALTGGLFGMYTRDRQDGTMFIATSRLFGWPARSTLYGFFARDQVRDDLGDVETVTKRQGISADQRWRTRGFQFVYGYRYERNHTVFLETLDDFIPFDVVANLAKLSSAALFDRRDDPINSRKGTFTSIGFDYAAKKLGSDVSNRKLLIQQFVFVPVGRIVLASRVLAGYAFGNDPLQFADRFRAGGASSVRGYSEDSLGPRDINGIPSGDRLFVLNQEARFPIYRWANGVVFADAGNIFAKGETMSWSELKTGYGVGLRFDTPLGLIRGDVGFPRSPLAPGSSTKPKWYFGFGHIF
ncbi:MAG TPA: BamA/TamA family outer membrane protein, partial [Vicinamibacterales bacterium]|nr:BamA/TamA family outer membrane protein [Vicinamibacterales bacterium]